MIKKSTIPGLLNIFFIAFLLLCFYESWFIPSVSFLIMANGIGVLIYVMIRLKVKETNKKMDKWMISMTSIYMCFVVAIFLYHAWTVETLISAYNISKLILTLLLFGAVYLNFVYYRAESSYKKKRSNQRIKNTAKMGYFARKREERERLEKKEICLILGYSEENDE